MVDKKSMAFLTKDEKNDYHIITKFDILQNL